MKHATNRLTFLTIPPLLGVVALASVTLTAMAQNGNDHSQAIRELNIMSNIFEAALEQDEESSGFRFASSPDALYLANQGMVFTFNMRNHFNFNGNNFGQWNSEYWQEFGMEMATLGTEIAAEVMANFPDLGPDLQELQDELSTGFGFADPEMLEEQQEIIREMNEAMRDRQEDIQDMQRDIRDAQREIRNGESAAENEAFIAALQADIDTARQGLEQQRSTYQTYMEEYEQDRQEQMEARTQAFSSRILGTLCDYGATMRSLQADEHITIILEDFTQDADQVYVMSYEDVTSCSSTDALLEQAESYQL